MDKGKASQLTFDTKVHFSHPFLSIRDYRWERIKLINQKGSQVFDIRDEASAQRECVIVWDPMTVVSYPTLLMAKLID
jgi:hypothetical protein